MRGGPESGQGHVAIGDPKNSELVARKAEVRRLREEFRASERRVYGLMEVPRSSCRYRSRRDDGWLRERQLCLAREHFPGRVTLYEIVFGSVRIFGSRVMVQRSSFQIRKSWEQDWRLQPLESSPSTIDH